MEGRVESSKSYSKKGGEGREGKKHINFIILYIVLLCCVVFVCCVVVRKSFFTTFTFHTFPPPVG